MSGRFPTDGFGGYGPTEPGGTSGNLTMLDARQKALLLLTSIRTALANGCRHYDRAGNLLRTDVEILQALQSEGTVTVDESGRVNQAEAN